MNHNLSGLDLDSEREKQIKAHFDIREQIN